MLESHNLVSLEIVPHKKKIVGIDIPIPMIQGSTGVTGNSPAHNLICKSEPICNLGSGGPILKLVSYD